MLWMVMAAAAVSAPVLEVTPEAGWICHYAAPKDNLERILTSDDLEKFEVVGTELVVNEPLLAMAVGKDTAPEYATHYRIIANTGVGIVATHSSTENGDLYTATISIMRDPLGKAVKTITSLSEPKSNVTMTGTCRSY